MGTWRSSTSHGYSARGDFLAAALCSDMIICTTKKKVLQGYFKIWLGRLPPFHRYLLKQKWGISHVNHSKLTTSLASKLCSFEKRYQTISLIILIGAFIIYFICNIHIKSHTITIIKCSLPHRSCLRTTPAATSSSTAVSDIWAVTSFLRSLICFSIHFGALSMLHASSTRLNHFDVPQFPLSDLVLRA